MSATEPTETIVMTFGAPGTSGDLATSESEHVREIAHALVAARERGLRVVGIVPALVGATEALLELAAHMSSSPDPRELDMLLSTGARSACALVAMAVHDLGHEAVSLTGSQAGILTDAAHTKASILEITPVRVVSALDEGRIVLVAGSQGFSRDTMDLTTLDRSGGDSAAVALAEALGARCEMYADERGAYSTEPRESPGAGSVASTS